MIIVMANIVNAIHSQIRMLKQHGLQKKSVVKPKVYTKITNDVMQVDN